jgi:hypothetical protein
MKLQHLAYCTATFFISMSASACTKGESAKVVATADFGRCDHFDPLRQPFFGDTHVHTNLSFDANLRGTRTGHREAYAFAKGGEIGLMPYDSEGNPLRILKADRPLDFVSISDHAEFFGAVALCEDPNSAAQEDAMCAYFADGAAGDTGFYNLVPFIMQQKENMDHPELCGEDNQLCIQAGSEVWKDVQKEAEFAYDRTSACEFTSFVAYEWTATPGLLNLHRNVIFRNEHVPAKPASYLDAPYVEDLWKSLTETCIDGDSACDVLTIPHNPNLASGLFFKNRMKNGERFDADYAAMRNAMEPIIEIYQHKGSSECMRGTPMADEFCSFENVNYNNFASGGLGLEALPQGVDFLRDAFGRGMQLQQSLGINPFQHGIVASTDTHLSIPGEIRERAYPGHGGAGQSNSSATTVREAIPALVDMPYNSPGGLASVWAEENSREAIFRAMRRKEVYGTSGPRIVARFFGGWDLPRNICASTNLAQIGYAQGVPMGGSLNKAIPAGDGTQKPTFVVSALQDAGTAKDPGTPLQRIQIVKGWLDKNGAYQVVVYDLNADANNGAAVDTKTCAQTGTGHAALCATWTDADFDPNTNAYYYARVLENPSCRWTTHACVAAGFNCENPQSQMDEACCAPSLGLNRDQCATIECSQGEDHACCRLPLEPVIQERAWTSPIWYEP